MGLWAAPSIWLWAALGIGLLMLLIGFGPLHRLTTRMAVELNGPNPDEEDILALFDRTV